MPKAKKIPGQHTSCSVVACGSKAWKTVPKPRFFRFPSRDKLQKQLWVAIIGRLNPDGSLWYPKDHHYICSNHFVGGVYSRTRGDVNYTPSLQVNWSLNDRYLNAISSLAPLFFTIYIYDILHFTILWNHQPWFSPCLYIRGCHTFATKIYWLIQFLEPGQLQFWSEPSEILNLRSSNTP